MEKSEEGLLGSNQVEKCNVRESEHGRREKSGGVLKAELEATGTSLLTSPVSSEQLPYSVRTNWLWPVWPFALIIVLRLSVFAMLFGQIAR